MIEIRSFSITNKKGERLLGELNIDIDDGGVTIICGRPGSGKTLLLKAIKGVISEGLKKKGNIKTKGRVGLVFQEPRKQLVRREVKMEAAFDLENLCFLREDIKTKIKKYADFLEARHLLLKDIDEISHGELTKTALLSTLVTEPDIILFDEPLSTLDLPNRKTLIDIIKKLKAKNITILIAEHDIRELVDISDRVILLKNGDILKDEEPQKMKSFLDQEGIKIPFEWELESMNNRRYDES